MSLVLVRVLWHLTWSEFFCWIPSRRTFSCLGAAAGRAHSLFMAKASLTCHQILGYNFLLAHFWNWPLDEMKAIARESPVAASGCWGVVETQSGLVLCCCCWHMPKMYMHRCVAYAGLPAYFGIPTHICLSYSLPAKEYVDVANSLPVPKGMWNRVKRLANWAACELFELCVAISPSKGFRGDTLTIILMAMASTPVAMAFNLLAMASKLAMPF